MRADLHGADLCGAKLRGTDLRGADLHWADLCSANLCEADLRKADLYGANLYRVNLREANLRGADLREANLYRASLHGAQNVPYIPMACPDHGSFIGFKKAGGKIVVLEITEDARRLSATTRKCRCDKAEVLRIENVDGADSGLIEIASDWDPDFIYRVGDIVEIKNFDENRYNECSRGIHFFINRQEAVEY